MRIQQKKESEEEVPVPVPVVEDKLELVKYLAQVQSRIKDHITSDLTYAKLGKKDKLYCLEMYKSASLGLTMLERIRFKAKKRWFWTNEGWIKKSIPKEEEDILKKYSQQLFDTFMKQIFMMAILNRNVKDNYLIKYSMGIPEEIENDNEMTDKDMKGFAERMKGVLKSEENNENKR